MNLELVHSDMRDFHRPDSFDIALSLFRSFGYFRDDEENQRLLNNVFANLRAGGVFILDAMGKATVANARSASNIGSIRGARSRR